MSTILDVARLAGVSKTTVSRVITNQGAIRDDTRQKILEAMKLLDYTPSIHAQGIRTGKSKTIAVFIPDHSNTFYNAMFRGIEDIAIERGYLVMTCNTNSDPRRELGYAQMLLKHNIDGFIYNTYNRNQTSLDYFFALAQKMPVVFMDDVVPKRSNLSYVIVDGKSSTMNAVKYLYQLGCRSIAYIRMPPNISVVGSRYEGYVQGLEECGLPLNNLLVYNCEKNESYLSHIQVGVSGAEKFMSAEAPPDAILSANDTMAIGAITYLVRNGWRIPQDVRVIGYDNIEMSSIIQPNLTTIAQPATEMGRRAAKILIDTLERIPVEANQLVLESQLLVREST
jgi:DNA-binding LacI/PurR family transcriptional regulator